MDIALQLKGLKFAIYAIVADDDICPYVEFIEQLKIDNPASYKSITTVLLMHADHGPLNNEQKSRHIQGDIWEFKSRQGARLPYFFLPGGITVITHGFKKGDPAEAEFKKAKLIMKQYIEGVQDGRK